MEQWIEHLTPNLIVAGLARGWWKSICCCTDYHLLCV